MPLATGDRYELALNGEGQPTFNSLPAILSLLDSEETEQRAEGASYLAQLVDSSHGDDATIFSDYLREAGGIEVIAELLLDREPFIQQKVLMVVGNLASDAFDPNSAASKAIFKKHDVMARLLPFLSSREWVTQLYAVAAVQNLSKDIDLAKEALQLGVHKVVQRLIRSEHELVVRYGARCPGSSSAKMRASLRRSHPAPASTRSLGPCAVRAPPPRHPSLGCPQRPARLKTCKMHASWRSRRRGAMPNLEGRGARAKKWLWHGPRVRSSSPRATCPPPPTPPAPTRPTRSHLHVSRLYLAAGLAAVVDEGARSARSSGRRSSSWVPRPRRPSGTASSRRSSRRRRGSRPGTREYREATKGV